MAKEISSFKVEKGVPMENNAPLKYPFDKMSLNDSFFIETKKIQSARQSVVINLKKYNAKNKVNYKIATRINNGGLRIWRIK